MQSVDGIIVKAIDGFYFVLCDGYEYFCKSRKKFRFNDIKPCVGDRVNITIIDKDKNEGVIDKIYERTSTFIRPQLSNVTQAIIVLAFNEPKLSLDLLNKLILNFELSNVNVLIVINKCDLHTQDDIKEIEEMFKNFPYEVLLVSVKENINIDILKEKLKDNFSCFCGPSGVGKSTLLNKLLDRDFMETSTLSVKLKRGKHTTRFSQLIYIKELNAYIADTPGFTSLEIYKDVDIYNLKDYFIEFSKYSNCKFRECTHVNEYKCEVYEEVLKGNINKHRYEFYTKTYNKLKERKNLR